MILGTISPWEPQRTTFQPSTTSSFHLSLLLPGRSGYLRSPCSASEGILLLHQAGEYKSRRLEPRGVAFPLLSNVDHVVSRGHPTRTVLSTQQLGWYNFFTTPLRFRFACTVSCVTRQWESSEVTRTCIMH